MEEWFAILLGLVWVEGYMFNRSSQFNDIPCNKMFIVVVLIRVNTKSRTCKMIWMRLFKQFKSSGMIRVYLDCVNRCSRTQIFFLFVPYTMWRPLSIKRWVVDMVTYFVMLTRLSYLKYSHLRLRIPQC